MIFLLLLIILFGGTEDPTDRLWGVIHGGSNDPTNPSGLPGPSTPVGGLFRLGGRGDPKERSTRMRRYRPLDHDTPTVTGLVRKCRVIPGWRSPMMPER